jgi:hypothetical protein
VGIVNYNVQGDTNFTYRFDFDTTSYKTLLTIKATEDGGVIVAFMGFSLYDQDSMTFYLAKFMPNGFVSIRDVATGDKESIHIYPVPAKDFIYVDLEGQDFANSSLELYNMNGSLVLSQSLSKAKNRINVSWLAQGAYTYKSTLNGKTLSGKLVVE